jgi:hypothetical protein
MKMHMGKAWHAAFWAVAALVMGLSMVPVAGQPVFAQTAGPPPGCGDNPLKIGDPVIPCVNIGGFVPGTEVTPSSTGSLARIPASNETMDLQTSQGQTAQLTIVDVPGPVTVQIVGAFDGLTAFDAQGNPLLVTQVSPGAYQVTQPS